MKLAKLKAATMVRTREKRLVILTAGNLVQHLGQSTEQHWVAWSELRLVLMMERLSVKMKVKKMDLNSGCLMASK